MSKTKEKEDTLLEYVLWNTSGDYSSKDWAELDELNEACVKAECQRYGLNYKEFVTDSGSTSAAEQPDKSKKVTFNLPKCSKLNKGKSWSAGKSVEKNK